MITDSWTKKRGVGMRFAYNSLSSISTHRNSVYNMTKKMCLDTHIQVHIYKAGLRRKMKLKDKTNRGETQA
jgi:hypothetical protein